jgi:methylase of polypeptide subunit release factors
MEKKQAQKHIKEVLNQSFDRERFEYFIQNLLNDVEPRDNNYSGNFIAKPFRDHIAYYKRIGKYTDPEGEKLDILIIQTRTVRKLERTRTALRNFVVRHLRKFQKHYALAAFYSKEDDGAEWRFSLIKIEYGTEKNEEGKIKTKEELVPAKRFSFLVGQYEYTHTAGKQLLPLLMNDHSNPLIVKEEDDDGSIEGAFSIQKITDEFYEQYKELYLKLAENESLLETLPKEGLEVERFVKKLLGQIVFLYFIQKKGWLGVPKDAKMGEGSKRFMQERFEQASRNGKNYYNSFLRYLFYDALAREHKDEGIPYYHKKLDCKIPFLNGGLFEAGFSWNDTMFAIPNELFRNHDKNKAGDKGTGILDVFDRYNFTIKEDEPLEKEVAVDPEMLGKVFENMLDIKERKSKGAFYTPREIVHYMCQESLINYLDNAVNNYTESYQSLGSSQTSLLGGGADKTGTLDMEIENKGEARVPTEDIEILIRKGHLILENEEAAQEAANRIKKGEIKTTTQKQVLSESISNNAKTLDDALQHIKICDPAIGSGAFPVGLLHEIVTARRVLNSFLQREETTSYQLKRHAIQNSIYGVDIDASAIDIARLRLWLSLIVDEEDYGAIAALPNLDYKIVQGNALIGLPENAMRDLDVEKEVEELKGKFFSETDEVKKKKLRSEINTKIRELLDSAEQFAGYEIDFDFKLFFSEVWHQKEGFDVVIGNPPYRQLQKFTKEEKERFKKQNYTTYSSSGDIYELFYENGREILHNFGHLTYITSNKWLRTNYGKSTRKFFLEKTNPKILFDFGQELVFSSAIVHSNIMIFQKAAYNGNLMGCQMNQGAFKGEALYKYFEEHSATLKNLTEEVWAISTAELMNIQMILESKGKKLSAWKVVVRRGVLTGFNKAFIIDTKKRNGLINEDPKCAEIIKPILRGRDTRRYYANYKGQYLINTHNGDKRRGIRRINVRKEYPTIFKYLSTFEPKIQERYDQGDHWSNLRNCTYLEEIEKPKIIFSEIVSSPQFYYDTQNYYPEATAFLITGEKLKWLIAFLNSTPITILFKIFYAGGELVGKFRYKKAFLNTLPIPEPIPSYEPIIETLVDYLTFYKGAKLDLAKNQLLSSYLELIIDGLVYEILLKQQISAANKQILPYIKDIKPIQQEMTKEKNYPLSKVSLSVCTAPTIRCATTWKPWTV